MDSRRFGANEQRVFHKSWDAAIKSIFRTIRAEGNDVGNRAARVEKKRVRRAHEHMERFILAYVMAGTHVVRTRKRDEHLVQSGVVGLVHAGPNPAFAGGAGTATQKCDVAPIHPRKYFVRYVNARIYFLQSFHDLVVQVY